MALYSVIQQEDLEMILSLKPDQIDKKLLIYLLVNKKQNNGKIDSRYAPQCLMTIPKGKYCGNKENIRTTLGLFIFNKLFIEESFYPILNYIDTSVTNKVLEEIEGKLSEALLEDKITTLQFIKFLDKLQFFSFTLASLITPSLTVKSVEELPEVKKRKEELFKENKKDLENGDVIKAIKIESELLDIAKEKLKGDPAMDLFDSGSKASFGNNYKNIAIMNGPKLDPQNGGYRISKNNYIEGIDKDDIDLAANALTVGAYSKGVGTQVGGYMTKKYLSAYQTMVLDKKGSDCGTNGYKELFLTKNNYKLFIYRYIIVGEKLVLLDNEQIQKYIGRIVKLRSPMYCISDKLCNKCAGELFYKLGIENIGLTTTKVSSTLMNKSLKKFHDVSLKLHEVDLNDIIF
jgi:hypothetical protein